MAFFFYACVYPIPCRTAAARSGVVGDQGVGADAGEVGEVGFVIHGPVLHGKVMRMGEVDDGRRSQIQAIALSCVAEGQLEHVVGAGEILFAGQGSKIELHDLLRTGAAVGVGVIGRDVGRDLVAEAADDDPVEQSPLFQRRVQLIRRGQTGLAAVLDLNDVAEFPGRGQIIQHLVEGQDPQLVRHGLAVEAGIRRLARISHKLRRHVQLLELQERLVADEDVLRAEYGRCVRHAVERGVVREHQNVVRRHMQVKFKIIHRKIRISTQPRNAASVSSG